MSELQIPPIPRTPLGHVAISVFVAAILALIAHAIPVGQYFAAEFLVSEIWFSVAPNGASQIPQIDARSVAFNDIGAFIIPRPRPELGQPSETIEASLVQVRGTDDTSGIQLEPMHLLAGDRVKMWHNLTQNSVSVVVSPFSESDFDVSLVCRLVLNGPIDFHFAGGEVRHADFGSLKTLTAHNPNNQYRIDVTPNDPSSFFMTRLAVTDLSFPLGGESSAFSTRARLGDSSAIDGSIQITVLDNEPTRIHPGDWIELGDSSDLQIDRITLADSGFKVHISGWAEDIVLHRRDRQIRASSTLLDLIVYTQIGRLIMAGLFALLLFYLEARMDYLSKSSAGPKKQPPQ